jgi:hypothetical protein
MNLFSLSFDVIVENVPAEFQIEVINLQYAMDLKYTFPHFQLVDFHKLCIPPLISFRCLVTMP